MQGTGTSDENVIVPWYNLHKVLAGLLDVAEYVDGPVGDQALAVATDFGLYVQGRVANVRVTRLRVRRGREMRAARGGAHPQSMGSRARGREGMFRVQGSVSDGARRRSSLPTGP